MRLSFAVCHAHAATDDNGKALQGLAINTRDQAYILRIDIHTIITGESYTDLEFARQIRRAIDRLNDFRLLSLNNVSFFTIEPDFMIGRTLWSKVHRKLVGDLLYLCLSVARCWSRTRHHVTVHITTGR